MESYSLPEDKRKELRLVCDHFDNEDKSVRERQIRTWKRLKFYWEGLNNLYWNEVAHDWRVIDLGMLNDDSYQDYYDKRVNVFKAYLESIIAALSVIVPPVVCYPDDADNPDDLETAKAGNTISKLVYRHNDAHLIWLHALYIYCTEGLIASYNYSHEDKSYGEVTKPSYKTYEEEIDTQNCSICGMPITDDINDGFDLETPPLPICLNCGFEVVPELKREKVLVTRLSGETKEPKSRQCIKTYGGLFVKIANYAKNQKESPYLRFIEDKHYGIAIEEYDHLHDKLVNSAGGLKGGSSDDIYEQWARLSTQYNGTYPENTVACAKYWLRPSAFNVLPSSQVDWWKKKFPNGVRCIWVNDLFAECEGEALDDVWTLTHNPLADYMHHDPLGSLLVSVQDITNDLISLALQTMEHGISTTMFDSGVLDANAYQNREVLPGEMIPVIPKTGKSVADAFYNLQTTTFSAEILPFGNKVQELGQLVSGAIPSLFGGEMAGSKTAAEYSMSRAQALQRLQNTWKMLCIWWKTIFSKVIPAYIKNVAEDERLVEKDKNGNFVNTFVRVSQLNGKIGRVELDASDQIPINPAQLKDTIMQILQTNHPGLIEAMIDPENIQMMKDALGMQSAVIPGEDDREKQLEEIRILLASEPIETGEIDEMGQPVLAPSVDIDPQVDDNELQADTVRKWAVSLAGRLAKMENPLGYKNVLLHGSRHIEVTQALMTMNAQQSQMSNNEKQPEQKEVETNG